VEVEDDGIAIAAQAMRVQQLLDLLERIIERIHEQPPHQVDDADLLAFGGWEDAGALARRANREVERPQQARLVADVADRFFLVPDVVAGGDAVHASTEQIVTDFLGDTEATGGVLSVRHHEIDPVIALEARQALDHHIAPRPPYDVTAEQQTHGATTPGSWPRSPRMERSRNGARPFP
jgi:hypothetical protein